MKAYHRGFTLTELLVVIGVLSVLAALSLAAVGTAKGLAKRVKCTSNVRQLFVASQMYWDDNQQRTFPYSDARIKDGVVYWFGWLGSGPEGRRKIDRSMGVLWPYLKGRGIELCPSFDYHQAFYKPKALGASYGYGYNLHLTPGPSANPSSPADPSVTQLSSPAAIALFADSAQINDFQAPATKDNPLVEEFYYVNHGPASYANGHFRHDRKAVVAFCDGHVSTETPATGTHDLRLPSMNIARLRKEILIP